MRACLEKMVCVCQENQSLKDLTATVGDKEKGMNLEVSNAETISRLLFELGLDVEWVLYK